MMYVIIIDKNISIIIMFITRIIIDYNSQYYY